MPKFLRQVFAINSKSEGYNNTVDLVEFEYDELGIVHHKKIHNQAETMVYAYDVAGRLNSFTSSKFSYNIGYDHTGGLTGAKSFYGGNISYMSWQNGSNSKRAYVYDYDGLNQLKNADFREKSGTSWTDPTKYDVSNLSYDENGNIDNVKRRNSSGGTLHDFSYTYCGNKLTSVKNGASSSSTYGYNANGNMTFDGRKGISITYNILNLPERIIKGSQSISYIYSADGQKLAMQNGSSLIYYRGGFIYNGNDLDKIIHEEGLVVKSSGGYNYYYALKDHLGSTRVLCKASGSSLTTEQTTEYYPFGLAFSYNSIDKNPYLFSGKEYQNEMIGGSKLELYDFGSRYYDTELGRWFAIDPAMQLVSPYGYCGNNPINNIDPNGEFFGAIVVAILGGIAINTVEKMINHDMSLKDAFMSSLQLPVITYSPSMGLSPEAFSTPGMDAVEVEQRIQTIAEDLDDFTNRQSGAVTSLEWEPFVGIVGSMSKELYYSEKYGTWMGKNFKLYKQTWGGNRFTGGKVKFAKTTSNFIKWGGRLLGAWNAISITDKYIKGEIGTNMMITEQAINLYSVFGGLYGAAWGFGWELGRMITKKEWYQEAKFNFWYNYWERKVGPPSQSNEYLWIYFYQNYKP